MSGFPTKEDENQTASDPWADAFARFAEMSSGDTGGDEHQEQTGDGDGDASDDPQEAGGQQVSDDLGGNMGVDADVAGGDPLGDGSSSDVYEGEPFPTQEDIDETINSYNEEAQDIAIRETAKMFVEKGVRNTNGKLGASIDDPDICIRREDGSVVFMNPDTGKPFSGDNPRAQARQWVNDYNEELRKVFNEVAGQRFNDVMESQKCRIETMRFAPTYEKLDPVRRGMFDAIIEDYVVTDDEGNLVGYSCDLNKALAQVDRQIRAIRQNGSHIHQNPSKQPTSPVGDMNAHGSTPGGRPQFKNLAEALEWDQKQRLEKFRQNHR